MFGEYPSIKVNTLLRLPEHEPLLDPINPSVDSVADGAAARTHQLLPHLQRHVLALDAQQR